MKIFNMKKRLALLTAVMMLISIWPVYVVSEGEENSPGAEVDPATNQAVTEWLATDPGQKLTWGDFFAGTGEGSVSDHVSFDPDTGILTVTGGTVFLQNVHPETATSQRIVISGDAKVVLAGVNIAANGGSAIEILPSVSATLQIEETNTVTGGNSYAGIGVGYHAYADRDSELASLTITGSGKIECYGNGEGAGIGGSDGYSNDLRAKHGNITINSGTIVAHGAGRSAGIGSSNNYRGENKISASYKPNDPQPNWGSIVINGGNITATGVGNGAGIGGGNHNDSGIIIINGGTINARGDSGIGSGLGSSQGSDKGPGYFYANVTINGGDITAYATNNMGAGIGGGMYSDAYVTITGGTVHASVSTDGKVYQGGAGIGGGYQGIAVVKISGGNVTATGGNGAPGIGNGALGASTTTKEWGASGPYGTKSVRTGAPTISGSETRVEISDGEVNARGGYAGAGIGSGNASEWCNVIISGGFVTARGYKSSESAMEGAAGIGSGAVSVPSKHEYARETTVRVSITGGTVYAEGGWGAAGVGSGAGNIRAASIRIGSAATLQAYSDGTKFALDTRGGSNTTVDKDVLQCTFMFPWTANSGVQNARGLNPIQIVNETTGESKTLTRMPEGYRSFATNVGSAGSYTVYSNDEDVASGNGCYFSVSRNEGAGGEGGADPDNKNGETILMPVDTGKLSDNYFLYPVKTIIVEKQVQTDGTVSEDGISTTAYFRLKKKGLDEYVGDIQSVEIVNGRPTGKAMFVNVPEGKYSIIETDAEGSRLTLGSMFGAVELKAIETRDHSESGTDNTGEITEQVWLDDVTVINTFGRSMTSVTVQKIWDDQDDADGIRPQSITVRLMRSGRGEPVRVQTITPDQDGKWAYTFDNLEANDENGQKITYSVTEDPVPGYETTYSDDTLTITNHHIPQPEPTPEPTPERTPEPTPVPTPEPTPEPTPTPTPEPEYITLEVVKVWMDDDNAGGTRPDSVVMKLTADGALVRTVELSAQNNWRATVTQLPAQADGADIRYTWTENEAIGYRLDSVVTAGTVTTFTNRVITVPTVPEGQKPPKAPRQPLMEITDYETALGSGVTINHAGDCFD